MKFKVEKSFDKDLIKIKDKKLLQKIQNCLSQIEIAKNVHEIAGTKKIEGFSSFYRIKIGDYRLGLELITDTEIILMRFLHRREVYRYFPKKKIRDIKKNL